MTCKHIVGALGCAVLALSTVGCGAFQGKTSELKSITLTAALVNGQTPGSQSGFFTLEGNGGTIQLQAMGEYSGGTTQDITHVVAYTAVVDPEYTVDAFGDTLLPPCQAPDCPAPQDPPFTSGTMEYSQTGLLTAVEPATCTWIDIGPSGTPSWFYVGDYLVTVSYQGVTSNPIFIPVASSSGNQYYEGVENNPTGACGPTGGS
ncbi:MAG: hypothetical protein WCC32_10465 [Terriglobales bacterium]